MITIAWYNVVATAVVLLVIFLMYKENSNCRYSTGYARGIDETINIVVILVLAALFYAIWGGIFWW